MKLVSKDKCTGCGLCQATCNHNAIIESVDELGFRYFSIDDTKCIECGLCVKKCPSEMSVQSGEFEDCYLAWSKDDHIHYESSSGGLAIEICSQTIEDGGFVCGCVWDKDFNAIIKVINGKDELRLIQGSKYVQSYIPQETFNEIKSRCKNGQHGVFIGVPCQVAAVKNQMGGGKNLLFIDLLCRGGCSPSALKQHLSSLKRKCHIHNLTDVRFRGGKHDCTLTLWDNERLLYKGPQFVDEYFYSFMKHGLLRDSCYSCNFAQRNRVSDLTLADFWGIDSDFVKDKHILNGTNVLIVHTAFGARCFESIKPRLELYKRDINEAIAGNDTLREPTPPPSDRNLILTNIRKYGFEKGVHLDVEWRKMYLRHQKGRIVRFVRLLIPDSLYKIIKKVLA